jgi:HEAT repeat protein
MHQDMDKHGKQKLLVAIALSFSCLSFSVLPISKGWAQSAEVSSLIDQLKHKNPKDRSDAADTLRSMGAEAKAAVPALIDALQHAKEPEVRFNVVSALWSIGAEDKAAIKDAVPALTDALQPDKEPDAKVRSSAANTLRIMGAEAKTAVPALTDALQPDKEPDVKVRSDAADALRSMGAEAKTAVPALIDALHDEEEVRFNAVSALGSMGAEAKAAVPALIQALQHDEEPEVRFNAVPALVNIAESLQDEADNLSFGDLQKAISDLEKSLKAFENTKNESLKEDTARVKRSLVALQKERDSRRSKQFFEWMQKNPRLAATIAIIPIVSILYLGVLGLRPQWLLLLPAEFTIPKTGIKPPILPCLKYRPRVLDAWVAANIDSARKGFQKKTTVSDRSVHIPIPVVLDGKNTVLSGKELQQICTDKRFCLLIWGEGGAGKTSLACQLAKWAMSDDATERLCKHPMLPVLIEQELNFGVASGKKPFVEAIRGQLQAAIDATDPIPDELLDRLLRQQRILVIADRLSEMSEATRKEICPGHPDFSANALIVTSRLEERLDEIDKTTIKPLRVAGNRLSSFMEAYLTQRGKRDLFTDSEFFDACRRLSLMVGQRNITVLLAKLYAEQTIAAKEGTAADLPDNIPDLMLGYLNELNRGAAENEPDNRTVQRDAKAIAWECLKQTYKPASAKRDDVLAVLAALNGNNNAEVNLKHLEKRLRLIQTVGSAQDKIRFALDPLAEYLAGLYLVEHYRDNEIKWREFLAQANAKPDLEAIQGFLLAVCDCSLAKGIEAKVPDFVTEELGTITPGDYKSRLHRQNPPTRVKNP